MAGLADVLFKVSRGDVLTPLVDSYWKRRGDATVFSRDTMEVLTYLGSRPPRNRTGHFSASALDHCMRLQTLESLDYPVPPMPVDPERRSLFHDGHWRHLRWQGIFLEMGLVANATEEDLKGRSLDLPQYRGGFPMLEWSVELPDWGLRGTIDVILNLGGERVIVDVKGAHAYSFQKAKEGAIPRGYLWQLQAYMEAQNLDRAIIWFEDKANQYYAERIVLRSDVDALAAKARARGLWRAFQEKRLPAPLAKYPTTLECRRCPFVEDCPSLEWTDQYLDYVPIG